MPTRLNRTKFKQYITLVQLRHPKVFNLAEPQPLALDAYEQIVKEYPEAPRKFPRFFLWVWCRRKAYLQALCIRGGKRFNLDGSPASYIDGEARKRAKALLAKPHPRWKP